MIESYSLLHANSTEDFFKTKGVCSGLIFKCEHQVSLFTGSGLQQNKGKFT